MTSWLVRPEGVEREGTPFPSAQAVADALRDGDLSPSDELRAPGELRYKPIDTHAAFAELCEELEAPPREAEEETHLDMNPLIDVSLVLLIFFILTATYSTLTRSLDVPGAPGEGKGAKVTRDDIKERAVTVTARMENDAAVITIQGKPIKLDDLENELASISRAGGKREAYLDVAPEVPLAVIARLLKATQGAEMQRVYFRSPKKS